MIRHTAHGTERSNVVETVRVAIPSGDAAGAATWNPPSIVAHTANDDRGGCARGTAAEGDLRRARARRDRLDPARAVRPRRERKRAYANDALPIECGQTISQPLVVARMLELLELAPEDRVLDVGTGSGYHAALLALLAGGVDDRAPPRAECTSRRRDRRARTRQRLVRGRRRVGRIRLGGAIRRDQRRCGDRRGVPPRSSGSSPPAGG